MTEIHLNDVAALRAMAHPMRLQILGSLRVDGPATSAVLARRLGTDSGQTSHHLRLLARHGFVLEAPELGKGTRGRERWWKAAHESTRFADDLGPGATDAVRAMEGAARQVWAQNVDRYAEQAARGEWSPEWRAAAGGGDMVVRLTPEALNAMRDEIEQLVERHDRGADPDAETVVVVVQAYPRRVGG
jgi:DNA-binding transcriptional ArsR family regulator